MMLTKLSQRDKIRVFFFTLIFLLPKMCLAIELNLEYPVIDDIDLGMEEYQGLDDLVAWWYTFIVIISGLATFFMFVQGGFLWLTSQGNTQQIGQAKDKINSALKGLVIILASYLILNVINPDLLKLKLPVLGGL